MCWLIIQQQTLDLTIAKINGNDRIHALVLRFNDRTQPEMIMRKLVADMHVCNVQIIMATGRACG